MEGSQTSQNSPDVWYGVDRMYSELISVATSTGGPHAARTSQVKLMRGVKRSALKLLETFVERCDDTSLIADQFVPAMLDPILGDYARGVPDARCTLT
jgi:exportin-1